MLKIMMTNCCKLILLLILDVTVLLKSFFEEEINIDETTDWLHATFASKGINLLGIQAKLHLGP